MNGNSTNSTSNTAVVDISSLDSYIGDFIEHWGFSLAPSYSLIESVRFKKGYAIVTCWTRHPMQRNYGHRQKYSFAPGTQVTIRFRETLVVREPSVVPITHKLVNGKVVPLNKV